MLFFFFFFLNLEPNEGELCILKWGGKSVLKLVQALYMIQTRAAAGVRIGESVRYE